jgi:adenylate cyclase
VLGDEVNLASRVESLTKFYHAKIMVTENTKKGQDDFIFRKLDKVKVKGKDIPVELYELICLKKDITPELSEELTRHHDALRFYFNQEWDKALTLFEALHREYPHTALYKIYCDRIREYKITPPPAAWNGCFEHLTK